MTFSVNSKTVRFEVDKVITFIRNWMYPAVVSFEMNDFWGVSTSLFFNTLRQLFGLSQVYILWLLPRWCLLCQA